MNCIALSGSLRSGASTVSCGGRFRSISEARSPSRTCCGTRLTASASFPSLPGPELDDLSISESDWRQTILNDTGGACFAKVCRLSACPFRTRKIRDLQSAPHRFASTQRPLARFVVLLDAILSVSQELVKRKQGNQSKARKAARQLLLDIKPEHVLALAMLADAGDESAVLLRSLDLAEVAQTEVQSLTQQFLCRLDFLFVRRGAMTTGYTAYAALLISCVARLGEVRRG